MSTHITVAYVLDRPIAEMVESIRNQMEGRSFRAANELRNASQFILRGARSGKQYNVPGTGRMKYYKRDSKDGKHKAGTATITYKKYTASAPGEPPAVRTGAFRASWRPTSKVVYGSYISRIESEQRTDNGRYNLGEILEEGTKRMAPRPYKDKIVEKALPKIKRIYEEPYF